MLHGGNYEHYLYRTRVTHVIATNLPNSKVKELKGLKVVRPEWITDRYLLQYFYRNYLLYCFSFCVFPLPLQVYSYSGIKVILCFPVQTNLQLKIHGIAIINWKYITQVGHSVVKGSAP